MGFRESTEKMKLEYIIHNTFYMENGCKLMGPGYKEVLCGMTNIENHKTAEPGGT